MSRLRVHSLAIFLDGYGAGPGQDLANPLGIGGVALHEWVFATRTFKQMVAPRVLTRTLRHAASPTSVR